ncbi:retrovirus-related Pol polyprotein from transposon TNT 1-94 [Trichonephila clavipes]|nr:retrovirus-related Pol polyprotein from transposon TNT 1-94 [Trichonephila clavipes]
MQIERVFKLGSLASSGIPVYRATNLQNFIRWKEEDFRVIKIEAELILEANRLQLEQEIIKKYILMYIINKIELALYMKQDLEKAENAYLSSFTSKKSKTLPGATAAAHGDPNGKNDYQKKSGHLKVNCKEKKSLPKSRSTVNETFNTEFDKDLKPITNMKMSLATEDKSCPVEGIGTLRFRRIRKTVDRCSHLARENLYNNCPLQGFSVSNGWERTEAISKREKGDDSKSDVIFFSS